MTLLSNTRQEKDLLGKANVPANALYGIQTQRAIENFNLSGVAINHFPEMIRALATVKQACAIANNQLGLLSTEKFNAVTTACEELKQGKHHSSFPIGLRQTHRVSSPIGRCHQRQRRMCTQLIYTLYPKSGEPQRRSLR